MSSLKVVKLGVIERRPEIPRVISIEFKSISQL